MTSAALSIQLYTVRDALAADPDGTLARLAEIGFVDVEAFGFVGRAAELRASLDAAGLRSPSAHASFLSDQLEPGAARIELPPIEHVLDEAATLGVEILIDPFVAGPFWTQADDIARTAERLNGYVDLAAERGIRLGYHNHSHEFRKVEDQAVMLEYMLEHTDPENVFFQLDVYWAVMGQASPVDLFRKYPGRFRMLHIKDRREIGQSGMVGFDAIFRNAELAGVEQIVVEQEESEYDIEKGVEMSLDYLLEAPFVKASYEK